MKLILPTSITFPRKTKADKRYMLNLNVYRNLNYIVNNQMKAAFQQLVLDRLYDVASLQNCPEVSQTCQILPLMVGNPPYRFTYTLFQETRRKTDVANVCCVVDKFAADSLVTLRLLEDDNHNIIKEVVYRYGGVDTENPRVELTVEAI